ncbi:hypothetical protein HPB50_016091 [Hyalomma asiaticum]|uniref:Uncharacterized protein n=1 Tax=Hyalomma asiaticum TaxID=266040 RepID=A0ACB7SWW8_HYAAI|nr:hypothetical protein HPB50_016091 [Hyalomma asiaticum]
MGLFPPGFSSLRTQKGSPTTGRGGLSNLSRGRIGATRGRRIPALRRKVLGASRMPQLPEEHQKIIVRPRNGLDLRKASHYGVSTAIFRAAGISRMEAETDLVCPNIVQDIVVVCTEKESNAEKLLRITSISVNGKEH